MLGKLVALIHTYRIKSGFIFCILVLSAADLWCQEASLLTRVGTPLPQLVWNGAANNWGLWVKNTDAARPFQQPLSVEFHIEQNIQYLGTWTLSAPLQPGDSVYLSGQIALDISNFPGPGPRQSWWCVTSGSSACFSSAIFPIALRFSAGLPSSRVGLNLLSAVPQEFLPASDLDLSFSVVNTDTTGTLFLPVSLLMSVDGQAPFFIATQLTPTSPLVPGDSFLLDLPAIPISNLVAGGGGLTHDIIVWPMRTGFFEASDSVHLHFIIQNPASLLSQESPSTAGDPTTSDPLMQLSFAPFPPEAQFLQYPGQGAALSPQESAPESNLYLTNLSVQVWPNPFLQTITLSGNFSAGIVHIALYDQTGVERLSRNQFFSANDMQITWNITALPPANYWLLVEQDGMQNWQLVQKTE